MLLDTNVLSELMRPQPNETVMDWFAGQQGVAFCTSAITHAEILLGISLLSAGKRRDALAAAADGMFSEDFAGRCLPFDESCAAHYAAIVSARRTAGFPITTEDAQIASIALSHRLPLVTRNLRDFLHIGGLVVCNPWDSP